MGTNSKKISVGVVGVGTMGRNHARVLSQIPGCNFVGVYDVNPNCSREICESYNCRGFSDLDELVGQVDAAVIAAPTYLHGQLGEKCLDGGIHVLMEKPLAANLSEAARLVQISDKNNLILMVGHIERYNPAVSLMIDTIRKNREPVISFEARRLNPFDGTRCLDVDVLYDLMIHDVDIALEIADSNIAHVCSIGQKVYSNLIDDAHSLLQFENGVTAVFWTSKCSPRKIREINITTKSKFYAADTISHTLTVHSADVSNIDMGGVCLMRDIAVEEICSPQREPLRIEIEEFLRSIKNNCASTTNGRRALEALAALEQISNSLVKT